MKSNKPINSFNKKRDFRIDSETDLSSIFDDDDNNSTISMNKTIQSSKISYCLVCSILPALTNVNCCSKHLKLLTKKLSEKIMHKKSSKVNKRLKSEVQYQINRPKSQRERRFSSISISSLSSTQGEKRKQPLDSTPVVKILFQCVTFYIRIIFIE